MPIDLDNNPLTRVVNQQLKECPNLYRAFQQDMRACQESESPHNAANVVVALLAIVCREKGLTPREAMQGIQTRIEELDKRVAETGFLLKPQPAIATGGDEEE